MDDPADLGVAEAAALLARRVLSSVELTRACLARIGARDGRHSADGDAASINAWIRVYEGDALAAAAAADRRRSRGASVHPLCGVPIGLKDLYAVAGKPLTASSRLLNEVPARDCEAWAQLRRAGMVLLGHLHTHEFAAGGTTDQVGNPWDLARSAGGSSGGSAAALAARMVPAASGTDTAGSLRIPSACCGTSTIKPTRRLVSLRGVVPLCPSLDHAGPMARSLRDCALLLAAMSGAAGGSAIARLGRKCLAGAGAAPLAGVRLAVSPRIGIGVALDADVAAGFDAVLALCARLGASIVGVPDGIAPLDIFDDYTAVFGADLLAFHRRFDSRREHYRNSTREFVEAGERRGLAAWEYVQAQQRRRETAARWSEWMAAERIAAIVEPTLPVVAPTRGWGYDHAFADAMLIALTHYWNWTGFPVAAFPAGVGAASGLPLSASLIGPPGSDARLLALGIALQDELGVPVPRALQREATPLQGRT